MATSREKWTNLIWALLGIVFVPMILFWYIFLNGYLNRRLFLFLATSPLVAVVENVCSLSGSTYIYSEYCIFTNHTAFCFIFSETWCIFSLSSCIICNGFYGLAGPPQIRDMINGNRFPIIQMLFYPLSLIAAFLTTSIVHSWWPVSPQSFPELKWGWDLYMGEQKTYLFQYCRETAVFCFQLEFPLR